MRRSRASLESPGRSHTSANKTLSVNSAFGIEVTEQFLRCRGFLHVSSNAQEFFGGPWVLIRKSFETPAHTMKVLDFVQNWLVNHISAISDVGSKRELLQTICLGQRT